MISSLYSGISGLSANTQKMAVVGDNIANVNTTAFKSSEISFDNLINQSAAGYTGMEIGNGVLLSDVNYNWSQGTLEQTTNPFDMAITGDGFFMVTDDDDNTYYTRAGEFDFNEDGELTNPDGMLAQGFAVTDPGPPPVVDPIAATAAIVVDLNLYRDPSVDSNGIYWAVDKATGEKVPLFQIALCDVTDTSVMAKMSGNLYTKTTLNAADPLTIGIPGIDGMGTVNPGSLEMSNVDLAREFVNMIVAQRAFSANSKVITTSDEILQELVNLKR
ncbi:MAG: flagellar hook-basal body complex protein [Desulfatirhabdiaceae bacterium]